MSEVALHEESILARIERTHTSATLPTDLQYEDFELLLATLGSMENAIIWWSADALIAGEKLYGTKLEQAAESLNRSEQTILNRMSIARRVPPERRNPNVSFTGHSEIAKFHDQPEEQERWLKIAEDEKLKTHQLRERIRYDQAEQNGRVVLPPTVTVEEAARHVWFASRRAVGDTYLVPAEVMLTLKEALGE